MKKLLTVLSASLLNREPRHRRYSLFSTATNSLSIPKDFDTVSFLCFSCRELNELAASQKAMHIWVETGQSNSSRARIMSAVRSSPSSVAASCICCLTDARAPVLEMIAPPRTLLSPYLDQCSILLLCLSAKAIWQCWGIECILAIHNLQGIDFDDCQC